MEFLDLFCRQCDTARNSTIRSKIRITPPATDPYINIWSTGGGASVVVLPVGLGTGDPVVEMGHTEAHRALYGEQAALQLYIRKGGSPSLYNLTLALSSCNVLSIL